MNRRPDILGEFTADHRAVEDLLARIEAGRAEGGPPGPLLEQLADLLLDHCAAEEEHLFPVVQHDVPDGGAAVFRCIHDHLAIGQYLVDILALPPGDPALGPLLGGLTELLRRHLATEEKQVYAAARKALPAAARNALAERLRAERAATAEAGP
ncbi:hemerythrin domain-containing protein [Kitasatospora misakiensis]|uniref:Hemerythrin domain-containing protein n=1 Tax=Kitasatospora misakiensis TaxID=67330 RepID=A0ABW0XCI3_9ACTN